ncbi:hypothetical protein WDU94_015397 [Cyamophila willieti]
MGTLKNLLRMSPERDKTLVKSNKFYVIRNEGVKHTGDVSGAAGDALKPVNEEDSSDSEGDSFKSVLSFNPEMYCNHRGINFGKNLFIHKMETEVESNDGDETFYSYENEIEDVKDKHFIEEVQDSKKLSVETIQPSEQQSTETKHGRESFDVMSKPNGDDLDEATQFKNELRKFVMLSKKLLKPDIKCKEKPGRSLVYNVSIENMNLNTQNNDNEVGEVDNVTSTEIIFKNSLSEWSNSDTRVLKLYNNTQPIVTTSSDTTQCNESDNHKWETCSQTGSKQTIRDSCTCIKPQDQQVKPKRKKKTQKKQDDIKCKQNFVRANKDLTKFVLKGRQKLNGTREKSFRKKKMKCKTKTGGRRTLTKGGDGERLPCKISLVLGCSLAVVLGTNVPTTPSAKTQQQASVAPPSDEKNPAGSVLDKLPILDLLKNPKVMDGYTGCLLDKGPCTPDAAEVKGIMPEALTTGCAKCTATQKAVFEKLILHYNKKQPEIFKEVTTKYDPKGEFNKNHLAKLKKSVKKD